MIRVLLVYPTGARSEVLLAGVPDTGDHIRLRNGRSGSQALVVEGVEWQEGDIETNDPSVTLMVRPRDK